MHQPPIDAVYTRACGHPPYDYQQRLAEGDWPDLLDIPTGLGKTAAVTLAWAAKRGWGNPAERRPDAQTPRRLVWCLPMRVLVEQTEAAVIKWLESLGVYGKPGDNNKVAVQVLMGGEDGVRGWAQHPEQDQIIIGTQDMLLSRALMRGYGMSRYQWPMDFALLHNDALWVFDEIQLMGAGLPTSTQLEAFRRQLPLAQSSRSLWISATLNPQWLSTVDFREHLATLQSLSLSDADRDNPAVTRRLNAAKPLSPCVIAPTGAKKDEQKTYLEQLAADILSAHGEGGPTLAILNTVDRAQQLTEALLKADKNAEVLLLHSRFRAAERRQLNQRILAITPEDSLIIVATQAIEAGVDLSAARLYTELAPWSSLVQRFGRCNRGGEFDHASIQWIELGDEKLAAPYDMDTLELAREKLDGLDSASSSDLPPTDEERPQTAVLRRRDLIGLFDTDPDLSGFDVDVSAYIRDTDGAQPLQVFWRSDFDNADQPAPHRDELCPVAIGQLKAHLGKDKTARQWDGLSRQWNTLKEQQLRPGMTLMLDTTLGGYSATLGFKAKHNPKKEPLAPVERETALANAIGADPDSHQAAAVALDTHLHDVHAHARQLCTVLGTESHSDALTTAALWHDVGKAHKTFQHTLHGADGGAPLLAKSTRYGKHQRPYFRHELASALSWLVNGEQNEQHDLIAYLIAAHHGKVRLSIRAWPGETTPGEKHKRYARGIWDGDTLPAVTAQGFHMPETVLELNVMELGNSDAGASWTSRTQALLNEHGPFTLAWLETLLRIADWRASDNPSATLNGTDD